MLHAYEASQLTKNNQVPLRHLQKRRGEVLPDTKIRRHPYEIWPKAQLRVLTRPHHQPRSTMLYDYASEGGMLLSISRRIFYYPEVLHEHSAF